MLTIALTGGIGCGKTTVCDLFAQHHVPVIDTDIIARELVEPSQPALREIVKYFSTTILFDDGSLNRKELAKKIFSDNKNRLFLESVLHPKIRSHVKKQLSKLSCDYAIIAIPLLIETAQQNEYDRVLIIDCTEQQQIERTLNRDNRSRNEIEAIIKSQTSRQNRLMVADEVINNSQNLNSLKYQVNKLHSKYLSLSAQSTG